MNLALLIGHFPPGSFGGAEIQAEAWARRLSDAHRVTVITRRDPPTQPREESRDGFRVLRLPVSRVPLWRTAADVGAIVRAVRGLPTRPDLLLCFQTFVSGLAGVRAQRALGIPAVVWIRGEAEYRLRESRVHAVVSPRVWRDARGVLVQSEENRVALLHELGRAAPRALAAVRDKLEVVPNGLDLPAGPIEPGRGVLVVGRMIADKGCDIVMEAMIGLDDRVRFVGDGPERERLEARAGATGVAARFEGFVSRERLDAFYREAGVVVLAARRGEGLPNVLLEAMAFGRPVVATPVAGTRDLVVDGVNGLLVPAGDAGALRGALARLTGDPGLRARLGGEARRTAERFGWAVVRPRLEQALRRWGGA